MIRHIHFKGEDQYYEPKIVQQNEIKNKNVLHVLGVNPILGLRAANINRKKCQSHKLFILIEKDTELWCQFKIFHLVKQKHSENEEQTGPIAAFGEGFIIR